MSNSPLVNYTKISPNRTSPRNHKIDTITIHCVVGQCSVETLGNIFANRSASASSNYGIGYDGKIGMYVEEKDRSWCSSSSANDNRAITIEVASDTTHPYAVKNKALNALVELLVDICKRNGIEKLVWSTNKSDRVNHKNGCNMTVHRDYANKACPGDYLYNKHGWIAEQVNKKLGATASKPVTQTQTSTNKTLYRVRKTWNDVESQIGAYADLANAKKACDAAGSSYSVFDASGNAVYPVKTTTTSGALYIGDEVKLVVGAAYTNGAAVPDWVINSKLYVRGIQGNNVVVSTLKTGAITGVVNKKYIKGSIFTPYAVKVTADVLNIRAGAGTNYNINGTIKDHGVYTIVEEKNGFGKLKSGAGWIYLDYTERV